MKLPLIIALFGATCLLGEVIADEKAEKPSRKAIDQARFYWLLNRACYYGDDIGARMLLDAGADVDGLGDYKLFLEAGFRFEPSWPINQASRGGHEEVVKLLLDRGVKVDSPEGEGFTALLIATMNGHSDLVEMLLGAGADRSYKSPNGTALDIARAKKFGEIVTLLTQKTK